MIKTLPEPSKQIYSLDILRGLASLFVCFFHLTGSAGLSKTTADLGKYGYLGVEMFFVISGFLIPYSLYKSNYKIESFFNYLKRRIIRIYPPYGVTILLTLVYILFTRIKYFPDFKTILIHAVFLNEFFKYDSISPVFWTLIIEVQFYIFAGLFFFLFNFKSILIFGVTIELGLLSYMATSNPSVLFAWLGMFIMGILLFRKKIDAIPVLFFWFLVVQTTLTICYINGIPEGLISLLTVLFILYYNLNSNTFFIRIFIFFGTLSYSLYLIHWEFGRTVVSITRHIPILGTFESFRVIMGMIFSVLMAYIFYKVIELPSHKLSKAISIKTL